MDHERNSIDPPIVPPNSTDQAPPVRRTSSRIARMNRSTSSEQFRPYPPLMPRSQLSTWLSQTRQMERQRNYYSHYYSSRNQSTTLNGVSSSRTPSTLPSSSASHSTSPSSTTIAAPAPAPITNSTSSNSTSTTSNASALFPPINSRSTTFSNYDMFTESIIRINNAATQTNSNINTLAETPATAAPAAATTSNQSYLLTPLHDYIRTIGAYITYRHLGRPSTIVVNTSANNNATAASNGTGNVNIDIEPINLEAFFGFGENYLNDGLSKQEINRHTVSYEYKPNPPTKRKRIKVEREEKDGSSATISTIIDSCSICLDKFNQNVQVRRLPCLHVFHIKCIDKWLKRNKKCPICRISITINYDTLMSSLESGSTIDQCLTQQELSQNRSPPRQTITLSLQRNLHNNEFSSGIVHATVELSSSSSTSGTIRNGGNINISNSSSSNAPSTANESSDTVS